MEVLYFIIFSLIIFLGWIFLSKRKVRSVNLYFYHLFVGALYVAYSINNPADTRSLYVDNSFENCKLLLQVPLDNANVVFCYTYILKNFFINNYGLLCSTFNFIGFLGINTFYDLLGNFKLENKFDKYLLNVFFYLPSLSFWTSINFKDSFVILAYATLIQFIYFYKINKFSYISCLKVVVTSLLALSVRPYSFFFIVLAILFILTLYTIKKFFSRKLNPKLFILFILILGLLYPSFNFISNQLSITSLQSDNLKTLNLELIDTRSKLNIKNAYGSTSYISQRGLSKSLIVFFGPFSKKSINYLIESISGVFFSIICIRILYIISKMRIIDYKPYVLFAFTIILLEFTKIQVGIFNLGTAVRHRVSIFLLVAVILMFLSELKNSSKNNHKLKNNYF